MFVGLSRYRLLKSLKVTLHQLQNIRHDTRDVFDFGDQKALARELVEGFVKVDNYTKVEIFVGEKRKHIDSGEGFVVVNKLDYKKLFELIILHVRAILAKMSFYFFVDGFALIISFEMLNNKKVALNIETFAKKFSNEKHKLKIAIEDN